MMAPMMKTRRLEVTLAFARPAAFNYLTGTPVYPSDWNHYSPTVPCHDGNQMRERMAILCPNGRTQTRTPCCRRPMRLPASRKISSNSSASRNGKRQKLLAQAMPSLLDLTLASKTVYAEVLRSKLLLLRTAELNVRWINQLTHPPSSPSTRTPSSYDLSFRGGAHLVEPSVQTKLPRTVLSCIECYVKNRVCLHMQTPPPNSTSFFRPPGHNGLNANDSTRPSSRPRQCSRL